MDYQIRKIEAEFRLASMRKALLAKSCNVETINIENLSPVCILVPKGVSRLKSHEKVSPCPCHNGTVVDRDTGRNENGPPSKPFKLLA